MAMTYLAASKPVVAAEMLSLMGMRKRVICLFVEAAPEKVSVSDFGIQQSTTIR